MREESGVISVQNVGVLVLRGRAVCKTRYGRRSAAHSVRTSRALRPSLTVSVNVFCRSAAWVRTGVAVLPRAGRFVGAILLLGFSRLTRRLGFVKGVAICCRLLLVIAFACVVWLFAGTIARVAVRVSTGIVATVAASSAFVSTTVF